MIGKTILIIDGYDRGKYAKVIKVMNDGNLSVRLEKGVKIIIRDKDYLVIK